MHGRNIFDVLFERKGMKVEATRRNEACLDQSLVSTREAEKLAAPGVDATACTVQSNARYAITTQQLSISFEAG